MSPLWLITAYFNPLGWRSRRENYNTFRRHLDARLLTASWSPEGNHELDESDADILIRVDGGDLMWQKERLINIGLAHLPDDCELVGWVDCDILFQDPLWQQQAIALLHDHEVIQLYGAVEQLEAGSPIDAGFRSSERMPSIIHAWQSAEEPADYLESNLRQIDDGFQETLEESRRDKTRQPSSSNPPAPNNSNAAPAIGFAWAARRSWLKDLNGPPDRAIIGSGDRHFITALLGNFDQYTTIMRKHELSAYCSAHTHQWAQSAQRSSPRINCLDGDILHLHHGTKADRAYHKRQFDLVETGFLPDEHLQLDPGGAWRFHAATPAQTRQVMARYFASRHEDGTEADG